MNNIFAYAGRQGAKRVIGRYSPTAKNGIVKDFFKTSVSSCFGGLASVSRWALAVEDYKPREVFMTPVVNEADRDKKCRATRSSLALRQYSMTFLTTNAVVSDSMTADDVPKWNSLSHIDMIFAVEKAFGVKFSIGMPLSEKRRRIDRIDQEERWLE